MEKPAASLKSKIQQEALHGTDTIGTLRRVAIDSFDSGRVRRLSLRSQRLTGVCEGDARLGDSAGAQARARESLRRAAEALDRRANIRLDWSVTPPQQGLRTATRDQRNTYSNQHDSPHAQATRTPLNGIHKHPLRVHHRELLIELEVFPPIKRLE